MIETIIYSYLNENASVPWYAMRPKDEPERYGLFEKTGASETDKLTTSTFAFQSYGKSLLDAAEISGELVELMKGIITIPEVSASRFTGEYNYTKTTDKKPRYQAVFTLSHY